MPMLSVVDFFNQLNMLYGTLTEACTDSKCPIMSAGPNYQYYWSDGECDRVSMILQLCTGTSRKVLKCTAPRYVDYLMTWVQMTLEDENVFPTKVGVPFPDDFDSVVKTIFRRLFRVYAHVYLTHFEQIREIFFGEVFNNSNV